MGVQRNQPQKKEQEKPTEKRSKCNEGKQFFRYRDLKNGYKNAHRTQNYNSMKKHIETIKKKHSVVKNTIFEIKDTLEKINSRLDEAEDQSNSIKEKVAENTHLSRKKKSLKMRIV